MKLDGPMSCMTMKNGIAMFIFTRDLPGIGPNILTNKIANLASQWLIYPSVNQRGNWKMDDLKMYFLW